MTVYPIDLRFQETEQIIASFLVEGPEGLALVETGPGSTRPNLVAGIEALGFSPEDVQDVFVTHIHLDHAGAAGWWAREYGSTIYVHPRGARHLINPTRLLESARMVYGDAMDSLWGEMVPIPEEKVQVIADNESASAAGLTFTAWDTPGHARHHHCYAIGDTVFTGDVAGVRLPGCDYISVAGAPPQFDTEAYLVSIDRIAAATPARLFLTHYGEVTGVETHLADYRKNIQLASDFVRSRIEENIDEDSLQVAYKDFQKEIANRSGLAHSDWPRYQQANRAASSADGIRLYWEKTNKNSADRLDHPPDDPK